LRIPNNETATIPFLFLLAGVVESVLATLAVTVGAPDLFKVDVDNAASTIKVTPFDGAVGTANITVTATFVDGGVLSWAEAIEIYNPDPDHIRVGPVAMAVKTEPNPVPAPASATGTASASASAAPEASASAAAAAQASTTGAAT